MGDVINNQNDEHVVEPGVSFNVDFKHNHKNGNPIANFSTHNDVNRVNNDKYLHGTSNRNGRGINSRNKLSTSEKEKEKEKEKEQANENKFESNKMSNGTKNRYGNHYNSNDHSISNCARDYPRSNPPNDNTRKARQKRKSKDEYSVDDININNGNTAASLPSLSGQKLINLRNKLSMKTERKNKMLQDSKNGFNYKANSINDRKSDNYNNQNKSNLCLNNTTNCVKRKFCRFANDDEPPLKRQKVVKISENKSEADFSQSIASDSNILSMQKQNSDLKDKNIINSKIEASNNTPDADSKDNKMVNSCVNNKFRQRYEFESSKQYAHEKLLATNKLYQGVMKSLAFREIVHGKGPMTRDKLELLRHIMSIYFLLAGDKEPLPENCFDHLKCVDDDDENDNDNGNDGNNCENNGVSISNNNGVLDVNVHSPTTNKQNGSTMTINHIVNINFNSNKNDTVNVCIT